MPRRTVSACIVCFNEEQNIAACLESVAWADEIVVVDSFSTDGTAGIAKKFTHKVLQEKWRGYVAQKNFALSQATKEWVLCLDADERCTPELREKIQRVLNGDANAAGYTVRRHVHYLGRWIDHGGWYPDWKLRLARRDLARWDGIDPHDKLIVDGPTDRLDAEILHHTYRDFAHQIRTINSFSDVTAEEWRKRGRRFHLLAMLAFPPAKFFETYVWKLGFLDGLPGFIISIASAFYVFAKHVKLWERR